MTNPTSKTEVESDLAQRLRACWRRIDPTSTDDDPVGMTMASALLAEAASAVEYLQAEHDSLLRGRRPTHRCKVCGALWIEFRSFWSLFSPRCGQCCDNAPDFLQKIVPLPKLDERLPVETTTSPFPMLVKLVSDNSYHVLHEIPNGVAFKVVARNLKLEDMQQVEPSAPRGKPCTCPDTSAAACGVERGHKLGELWFCKRAQVKAT